MRLPAGDVCHKHGVTTLDVEVDSRSYNFAAQRIPRCAGGVKRKPYMADSEGSRSVSPPKVSSVCSSLKLRQSRMHVELVPE